MTLYLNGTTGISGVDGSAGTPAVQGTDTNTGISFPAADTIAFNEGGAEAMRIDSSSRLLVGTSSARSNFSSGFDSAALQIEGTGTNRRFSITGADNASVLILARQRSGSVGGNTVLNSGDLISSISFQGNDGTNFTEAAAITTVVDGTPGTNDMPGRLVFSVTRDGQSSPSEAMRIDNQGRVETTCVKNDNAAFVVTHNGTSGSQYGIAAVTANDQNSTSTYFYRAAGGSGSTERFTVRTNGGIANYSASNVNLSDINTKKDITPAAGTWDCIKEWEIVNYRYKDQPDDADLNFGVIAQQVAESCPEVITVFQEAKEATEDQPAQEERLGVKEQQMYWMAIKALQEAMSRIETLEAEVSALKAQ